MKTTLRHIYLCRATNMSWRTCVVVKQIQSNQVSQNSQNPSIIGICSYYVLDRPVFERCQTLLHPELTPWWSFLLADGAHHKKPHGPTHPIGLSQGTRDCQANYVDWKIQILDSLRLSHFCTLPQQCEVWVTITQHSKVLLKCPSHHICTIYTQGQHHGRAPLGRQALWTPQES